jgi:vacuolar iron transporter family protein
VRHREQHHTGRVGWLRAAVLGANDGLISTSSLVIGVAAADAARGQILLAALAGLVSGAFSMAAGEYVSVSSQADTERADLEQERRELAASPEAEHAELAGIYTRRGLTPALARQVADELMSRHALAAHARDELGLSKNVLARPIQAALASAASFTLGALLPVILVLLLPARILVPSMAAATLLLLALLGATAARLGGASRLTGSLRVGFWGAVAMSATALVGRLFGTAGL